MSLAEYSHLNLIIHIKWIHSRNGFIIKSNHNYANEIEMPSLIYAKRAIYSRHNIESICFKFMLQDLRQQMLLQ